MRARTLGVKVNHLNPYTLTPSPATSELRGNNFKKSRTFNRRERVVHSGLIGWEGYHESRRCSRDTYPETYITKYTSIRRKET